MHRTVQSKYAHGSRLNTVGDAVEYCRSLIEKQIVRASAEKAKANEHVEGDAISRIVFLTLLPNESQRRLFLEIMNRREVWPRCFCLFGAPPFYFLRSGDAEALETWGFSQHRRRKHMTYERSTIPSLAHFGVQYTDEYDRDYRVGILDRLADHTFLPGRGFFDEYPSSKQLVFNVKVRKRSSAEKRRLMKTIDKERILMPRAGQLVRLTMSQPMRTLLGISASAKETTLGLKIVSVLSRGVGANTSSVIVKRIE
jgi:hypothetical protein